MYTVIKKVVLGCIFFTTILFAPHAQPQTGVHYSISFYNQQIYFPGDPIQIRMSIKNDSPSVYTFRIADNRIFNVEFEVVDLRNVAQVHSEHFTTTRNSVQRVYFREISLNPGEEFSFIETLNHYKILDEGVFVIRSHFYPELVGSASMPRFTSNRLTLSIRPGYRLHERVVLATEERVQTILQAQPIPPDEVVAKLIEARMQSNRQRFFLHLDVTSLYRMDPRRDSQFRRISEQDQFAVLQEFQDVLWDPSIQDSISRIPMSYQILRTSYDATTAQVEAIQRYQMNSFVEVKRFSYRLNRRDGVWYVVSYTVTNMGTE